MHVVLTEKSDGHTHNTYFHTTAEAIAEMTRRCSTAPGVSPVEYRVWLNARGMKDGTISTMERPSVAMPILPTCELCDTSDDLNDTCEMTNGVHDTLCTACLEEVQVAQGPSWEQRFLNDAEELKRNAEQLSHRINEEIRQKRKDIDTIRRSGDLIEYSWRMEELRTLMHAQSVMQSIVVG